MFNSQQPEADDWRPAAVPRFDMSKMADNHSVLDEAWSFLQDPRNEWPVNGKEWLGLQMCSNEEVRQRWFRG